MTVMNETPEKYANLRCTAMVHSCFLVQRLKTKFASILHFKRMDSRSPTFTTNVSECGCGFSQKMGSYGSMTLVTAAAVFLLCSDLQIRIKHHHKSLSMVLVENNK